MGNFSKQKKGITLIALVITIIVLLILAGISISMLSGDNSILQKSTNAKTNTDNSQIVEKVQLAYTAALVEGKGTLTETNLRAELTKEFGENGYDLSTDTTTNEWVIKVNEVERLRVDASLESYDVEISFTIWSNYDSSMTTYTAKQGMTFKEWMDEYAPDGIRYNGYIYLTANDYFVLTGNGYTPSHFVMESDTITDGATYSFYYDD